MVRDIVTVETDGNAVHVIRVENQGGGAELRIVPSKGYAATVPVEQAGELIRALEQTAGVAVWRHPPADTASDWLIFSIMVACPLVALGVCELALSSHRTEGVALVCLAWVLACGASVKFFWSNRRGRA